MTRKELLKALNNHKGPVFVNRFGVDDAIVVVVKSDLLSVLANVDDNEIRGNSLSRVSRNLCTFVAGG